MSEECKVFLQNQFRWVFFTRGQKSTFETSKGFYPLKTTFCVVDQFFSRV